MYNFWIRLKVVRVIILSSKKWHMVAIFWKLLPERRMDAAAWRFPANIPLYLGCEAQESLWPFLHSHVTMMAVPRETVLYTKGVLQRTQWFPCTLWRSSRSLDSYTMHFFSEIISFSSESSLLLSVSSTSSSAPKSKSKTLTSKPSCTSLTML